MNNKVSIDIRNNKYLAPQDIWNFKEATKLNYYLIVNGEEVEITRDIAFGMTGFIDEMREQLRKELIEEFLDNMRKNFSGHKRKAS